MDLKEPNTELTNSIWEEIIIDIPNIELSDEPTEEEVEAFEENKINQQMEFISRYDTQRSAQILADRDTLDASFKAEVEKWDNDEPEIYKSGHLQVLGNREIFLRQWATNSLEVYVPQSLTPRQFRLSMLAAGIEAETIVTMLSGNDAALIEWEYATEVKRDYPLLVSMGAALGKTEEEIDAIFIYGETL